MYRTAVVVLFLLLGAGCSRGPDTAGLAADVQARLDALFGRPVLVLRDFRRQGSAPFSAAEDGAGQAIVYYNATLAFAEPYDPSDWEGISPRLIARALGATDEGVVGLESGRMDPGAELRAYGSLVYRREADEWQPTDLHVPQAPAGRPAGGLTMQSREDELIARLSTIIDTAPGLRADTEEIVAEELDRALQNIQLRLDQDTTTLVVATGPEGGEYARFIGSLATRLGERRQISIATTEGSVANAFLVDRGKARFGLVQSDVAAAAVTGAGLFATTGPLRHIRAVASLFPEPLHVAVRADSDIRSIADLAGRKVSLGQAGSGTRQTALVALAAHGLDMDAFNEAHADGPEDALAQLIEGRLDAVVEVASAPWGQLSTAADRSTIRLLSLDTAAVERISAEAHGVVPLTIPARTYRGQDEIVHTVAATALLVVNSELPESVVYGALEVIFAAGEVPGRGVSAARLSRARALVGVTIPLHDGAARYFEAPGLSAPAAPSAPAGTLIPPSAAETTRQ
jgi:TRAP transporter TAXI family solute receptor